ncbi:type II secretion system protein N [Pseudomonas reactans]|uniref:type II secretion system protein N n=1 Tax=Pseudomonas reactans TaxID=117680 RepID=UPI003CCD7764
MVRRALVLMWPVGYGLMLGWQEWQFRQVGGAVVHGVSVPTATAEPLATLNTLAIATVLGFTEPDGVLNSAEPLTLRATVVASDSESRALLAGPDIERFYRPGERLPGGSVLRRIEPTHVVVWRQGREEVLRLRPLVGRFLQAADTPLQAPAALHFRPHVEQPRSD